MIQEERDRLDAQLKELSSNAKKPEDVSLALLEKVKNVYAILTSDKYTTAQKSEAIRQVVDKIIFDRHNDTLKIYYFYYV